MQQETQSLPSLSLSNEQQIILHSLVADAMARIVSQTFTSEKQFDQMMACAYQRGRLDSYTGLLKFDETALEQAQNNQTFEG